MKILSIVSSSVVVVLLWAPLTGRCQGFQNLDFESANVPSLPPGDETGGPVSAAQGLPGWTVYLGGTQQIQVEHNFTDNTLASVDILGPNWQYQANTQPGIIGGNYSVYLQSGYEGSYVSASIAQDGTVPANAASMQLKAWETFGGSFSVSFNGNNLPLTLLSTGQASSGQPYNLYGVDIAPYAGQTGLLEFTEPTLPSTGLSLALDDINFSTSAVPEPGPAVLLGIGGLVFAAWRRFVGKKS